MFSTHYQSACDDVILSQDVLPINKREDPEELRVGCWLLELCANAKRFLAPSTNWQLGNVSRGRGEWMRNLNVGYRSEEWLPHT
jgi:hypothetical protein